MKTKFASFSELATLISILIITTTGCLPLPQNWYADADSDSYGDPADVVSAVVAPSGYVEDNTDCDDSRADVNPGGLEVLDGLDNDCDGVTDAKYVFISSSVHTGNLGGLAGADSICQSLANAASMPGVYKAWLSDATQSAANRLTHSLVPYILPTLDVVADSWSSLLFGPDFDMQHAINIDEQGNLAPVDLDGYTAVWTGTLPDGNAVPPDTGLPYWLGAGTCDNWTNGFYNPMDAAPRGINGFANYPLPTQPPPPQQIINWSSCDYPNVTWCGVQCGEQLRLYCFQQ